MIPAALAALDLLREFLPWIVAGIASVVALVFKGLAGKHKKRAEIERQRADSAEVASATYQRIEDDLTRLNQKQSQEIQDEEQAGGRDFFGRDWQ